MNHVRRLKIYVLGPRDYPEAVVTVPEHFVAALPELVERARAQNPTVRLDTIIATIWRLGSYRLGQNLLRAIPVRVRESARVITLDTTGSKTVRRARAPRQQAPGRRTEPPG